MTVNEKKDVLEEKMNESLQELVEAFEGEAVDTNEDEVIEGATDEEEHVEITEENMTSEMAEKNIVALLKQVKDMVGILESMWRASESEFDLKDSHMKELMAFNSNHLVPLTEGATEEERENWDPSNGLDALTEEDVVRIFGEEHKIIGVEHSVTLSRIKDCFRDFYGWLKALREYGDIQDSYMTIMEEKEEMALQTLREAMEKNCLKRNVRICSPAPGLCTDNGAMIGCRAYYMAQKGDFAPMTLNADPRLPFLAERGKV